MMTQISLIAAIDEKRGLGKDNQLLCHLPADLKYFKEITWGKPVIMGRKTYDSIGKPLPGRHNIVLSRESAGIEGVTVVRSLDEALTLSEDASDVMIIGGASLFELALPIAHQVFLTVIHAQFEADVFFPKLDLQLWRCLATTQRPHDEKNKYDVTFYRYRRLS